MSGRIKFSGALASSEDATAACEERDRPAKRSKRPNQLPPTAHHRRTVDGDTYVALEDDDEDRLGELVVTECSKASRQGLAWDERKQRNFKAWGDRRELDCQCFQRYKAIDSAPDAEAFEQMLADRVLQRKARALENHTCVRLLKSSSVLTTDNERPVKCHFLGAAVTFAVPTLSCSQCKQKWELNPVEMGFWPCSPVVADVWYDMALLDLYTQLAYGSGVSTTAYADALEHLLLQAWNLEVFKSNGQGPMPTFSDE
jgi:hypothetical protein